MTQCFRHRDTRPGRETLNAWRFEEEGSHFPEWLVDADRNAEEKDLLAPISDASGNAAILITNTSHHDTKSYDVARVGDWIVEDVSSPYFRVFALDDARFREWYEAVEEKPLDAETDAVDPDRLPDVTDNDTPENRAQWAKFVKGQIDVAIIGARRIRNINVTMTREPSEYSGMGMMRVSKTRGLNITIDYLDT